MKTPKLKSHRLPDCFAVYYGPLLADFADSDFAHVEEICQQGWADAHLGGINRGLAVAAKALSTSQK